MPSLLYIWKGEYPWDVRAEKFCNTLADNGFDVIMLARRAPGQMKEEQFEKFRVIRVGHNKAGYQSVPVSSNPIWKKAIKKAIERFKPSVIIPREIMLAGAAGHLGRKYSIPVIMDMAENYPAVMKGWKKYKRNLFRRMAVHWFQIPEKMENRSVHLMDGIITVCEEQCERLNKEYSYPFEKMEIVRNTPDLNDFDSVIKGITEPPELFAYHGYVNNERNLKTFIIGFIDAARRKTHIRLEIAGSGEELDELRDLVKNQNMQERISFTGEYDPGKLNFLYSKTDIAVLPYKINDHINNTVSNKLFDYMASGKPMIVSEAIPMVRLMNETGAGISVDCDSPEEISKAIMDIQNLDLEKMSQNGQIAAREKYNWETDSKKLVEFIKKFI